MPSGITSGGVFYALNTDFRVWIDFGYHLEHDGIAVRDVFADKVPPTRDALDDVLEFYRSSNVTPKSEPSNVRALDMVLDGDYIVASFQQAYGIDLTSIEYMHWHRFKALLNGLPDDTVLGRAIGYRTYKPTKKKHEDIMLDQKRRWTLPPVNQDEKQAELVEWAEGLGL